MLADIIYIESSEFRFNSRNNNYVWTEPNWYSKILWTQTWYSTLDVFLGLLVPILIIIWKSDSCKQVIDAQALYPKSQPSSITNIQCHDVQFFRDHYRVSFTLSWLPQHSPRDPIDHVNIYSSLVVSGGVRTTSDSKVTDEKLPPWKSGYSFVGRSYSNCYRVANYYLLETNKRGSSGSFTGSGGDQVIRYKFYLQPVRATRSKPSVGDSPCVAVTLWTHGNWNTVVVTLFMF